MVKLVRMVIYSKELRLGLIEPPKNNEEESPENNDEANVTEEVNENVSV